ncbi:MAG: ferrous iron transport protein B, partial [Deltaproteobacteria bacterium]|nr:ferrous iron transport protein B [Deltaproteobacteria bacterium]
EKAHAVLHIIDTKNIERMLGLSLQLIEAGLPVIVVLNMSDEAHKLGIRMDARALEQSLGVPVVMTTATTGEGVDTLISQISARQGRTSKTIHYGEALEKTLSSLTAHLGDSQHVLARTRALLLVLDPQRIQTLPIEKAKAESLLDIVSKTREKLQPSVEYHTAMVLRENVNRTLQDSVVFPKGGMLGFQERLSRILMNPLSGVPILVLVLYYGIYKFVGEFGGGTLVDLLETNLFENTINPWVENVVSSLIPWPFLQELFIKDYGIFTLGIRYAVAIILPIVGTFFIAFSVLEDSGYLPRLAMLIDSVFKKIGLNGRAVIPIVLGFGCGTMATMVTRTLETKRERLVATLLLALAIPCSAQLGLIFGLLAGHPYALIMWMGFITAIFLFTGLLAARILPGTNPSFYMEMPPLRLPRLNNVAVKTYSRMVWYFKEILPLFILASVFIWVGQLTGLFQFLVRCLLPVVKGIGLPDGAAVAFLFGFFRRDYGAAGLYDLHKTGALSAIQLTVAAITLTLFLPCVAQFLIMKKERGAKTAILMGVGIFIFAFATGFAVNTILNMVKVAL